MLLGILCVCVCTHARSHTHIRVLQTLNPCEDGLGLEIRGMGWGGAFSFPCPSTQSKAHRTTFLSLSGDLAPRLQLIPGKPRAWPLGSGLRPP